MANNIKKFISAGFERVYYGLPDSAGYVFGNLGSFIEDDAGYGMLRLDGVKTADITIPDPETKPVTGDDGVLGQFIFPPNDVPAFTITTGQFDMTYAALAQGVNTVDLGNVSYLPMQPNDPTYPDMCLLFLRRSKSKASGSSGASNWEGMLIPRATVVPQGPENYTEREVAGFRYRVSCNVADTLPWGTAIGESVWGTTGAPLILFSAPNRIHMQSFLGGMTVYNFGPLLYTPAASGLTSNRVYVNGVPATSGVTINTTTKMVAFGSAQAASKIVVVYEHI